jgi:hypothetical protein
VQPFITSNGDSHQITEKIARGATNKTTTVFEESFSIIIFMSF